MAAAKDEPSPPPKRRATRRKGGEDEPAAATPTPSPRAKDEGAEAPRAPKRAQLSPEQRTLLAARSDLDGRRPAFVRQAAHRYWRIGRDGAWRRPRGLQSKQRRHYGYRSVIVRIGYRSPAAVRGRTPTGFVPVLVRNRDDLDGIEPTQHAAVIARTVGTRRRLVLEEEARRLGIHVLNPIVVPESEE